MPKFEKILRKVLNETTEFSCPSGYQKIKIIKKDGKDVVDKNELIKLEKLPKKYCVWCRLCWKKRESDEECEKSENCPGTNVEKPEYKRIDNNLEIEIEPEPEKKKEYVYVPSEEELRAKEEARLKKEFDEFVKKKGLNFSCGEFTGFSKGCVNEYVEKLRKCLNKHPNYTPLPIDQPREKGIDPNYIWDDDLENRFNEIFPDKKGQSQSKSEINQICLDIDAIVEKLKQSDNKNDNSIIDTPVQDIKNTDKKLQFKDIPESRVITKKRLIKEIDEKKEQLNRDLVYMKSLNTTYKYCLPKWFSNTKVQSLDERVVIVGVKKWPDNQTTDDPKPELDGATYYVDTDLNMHRYDDTGILATQQIFCSSLVKSKANFDERAKYKILLQLFNVNSTLKESDFLTAVNKITSDINKMVDIGYKSDRFTEWKNFLDSYFKNKEGLTPLTTKPFFYANLPETDKQNYVEDSDNVSKNVGWNIIIYKDKSTIDYVKPDESITVEQCRQSLSLYLRDAIVVTSKTGTAKLSETQKRNKATDIFSCKGLNRYNKNDLYYEKDVLEGGYDTIEKSPFVKIGNPLKYSQIVDYLSGKDREGFFGKDREYTGKYLIRPNVYILDKLNESFGLNDKIKLTLNEIVLEKRKVILQEKVIRNRVDILFENQNFDSRKKRREFVLSLLKEALYIESQGFNKQIINEEFWDVVKGFFGDEGSQSVFKSFKTRMSEWLTSHLTPKKADGWIGNCIRKTIKDIDIEDVHLITDCKYLTRKISRSIVEKLDEKMNNNELKDEGLYDIVRGGMSNNVKSAKFRTHIEEKVSKMICPILNDMSTKFDETFEKMKKRALDVFD